MPLESIQALMLRAEKHSYAVGYFESWSLDSLQGVIDAAEHARAPVIIGFNGEFLSQRSGATPEELLIYGTLGRTIADRASIPCGLIFNECSNPTWLERALTAGFNLVMPAGPLSTGGRYTAWVERFTAQAHSHGVAVEAQVERSGEEEVEGHEESTEVEDALRFVRATHVDLLAVQVGNQEIKLVGRERLNLERLAAIHLQVEAPLVLHGGTGIEDDSLRAAIRLGVRKVNYGTYLKQRYLQALHEALATRPTNPHALLGDGSDTDLTVIGRRVIREAVLERIELLGCCGRA